MGAFSILFLEKILRLLMELISKLTILNMLEYLKDILKFLFQMDHMVIGEHQESTDICNFSFIWMTTLTVALSGNFMSKLKSLITWIRPTMTSMSYHLNYSSGNSEVNLVILMRLDVRLLIHYLESVK